TGEAEEAAKQLEALGRSLQLRGHLWQPGQRQEVREGPIGPLDRQLQHLPPQRRQHHRYLVRRLLFQLESGWRPLALQRYLEEVERLAHLAQWSLEGDPVPALDDPV